MLSHLCYSTVTCKALLNWPHHKLGQYCVGSLPNLGKCITRRCTSIALVNSQIDIRSVQLTQKILFYFIFWVFLQNFLCLRENYKVDNNIFLMFWVWPIQSPKVTSFFFCSFMLTVKYLRIYNLLCVSIFHLYLFMLTLQS